ncbi:hypothetical protein CDAR_549191 [Caerostris darwini]|uniref:Uncharacterized protein n=1 Tax=Caerostris darwini TaxID=1538125 RepID=A0AAV4WKU8_9ARAC|nr:hypothetical protein CDAR_549191 [Caerostris darwini]
MILIRGWRQREERLINCWVHLHTQHPVLWCGGGIRFQFPKGPPRSCFCLSKSGGQTVFCPIRPVAPSIPAFWRDGSTKCKHPILSVREENFLTVSGIPLFFRFEMKQFIQLRSMVLKLWAAVY